MTTSSFSKSRLYLYHTAAWGSLGGLECCGADANQGAPWAIQSVNRWGFNIRCGEVLESSQNGLYEVMFKFQFILHVSQKSKNVI
eukprot:scaffold919_cov74-Cyclotella_meneghiniana.AAC.1